MSDVKVTQRTGPRKTTLRKTTLRDLVRARVEGPPRAMLTCYDHTTATLLAEAGVDHLLVGDSAANVILGHDTTVPISQRLLVELCRAVRRGHPSCHLVLDAAFGPHFGDAGAARLTRAFKASRADAIKVEATPDQGEQHLDLVRRLAGSGVPVIAHVGLAPQHVLRAGGYRYAGRTAEDARRLAYFAKDCQDAGAVALLLEATTAPATRHLLDAVDVPVIGCGAGPGCAAYVVVLHDLLGLTPPDAEPPRFVPDVLNHTHNHHAPAQGIRGATLAAVAAWRDLVATGRYPARRHGYPMPDAQRRLLLGLEPGAELPDDDYEIDEPAPSLTEARPA